MTEVASETTCDSEKLHNNPTTDSSIPIGNNTQPNQTLHPKTEDRFQHLTAWGCLQYNLENQHEQKMDTAEPQNKEQTGHNSSEQPSPPSSSNSDSSSGNGSSSGSGTNSPISVTGSGNNLKPKRLQVPKACMNCRKKKAGCDRERPCKRCIQSGEEATCVDIPRKKRGPLTINSPTTPIVATVTAVASPVPTPTATKEIELLANLSNPSSSPMINALFGKQKPLDSNSHASTSNTLLHTVTNNAGQASNQTSHTQPLNATPSGSLEQLSKQQSLATTAPTSTPNETQLIANNLEKERAAKLLSYLVEKHSEQQLLSTYAMECTAPHNHSELVDSASDQVLIKDYIHAIFDKASKCNDWNLAVATVVSLVEEGVHLLNCYQPRQSLVYFTGFLEGILKYEPWVSCFQQMHQHVADVPYIVESFCAKLLEFDGILNEYEKEIIRTRLEPFRLRMDKSKPNYHDFMIVKPVGHNGHVNLPAPASQFVDPYDMVVTRKFIPPNNPPTHNGLHFPNASINHFQTQNPEHHAQSHSSTNNGKHPSKHMFL